MPTSNGPVTWRAVGEISERVARIEERYTGSQARGNRVWIVVIGIVTAVVCPLVVTAIIAFLHLGGT